MKSSIKTLVVITMFTAFATQAYAEKNCRLQVSGIVQGPKSVKIPAGSVLELSLYDAGIADAPASITTAASIKRSVRGKFPIRFKIESQRCMHMPAVSASIRKDSRLLFINDTTITAESRKKVLLPVILVK
ncbi:YbaY family lipoprotein [Aquirhabdus sp.]|uniref:YbaY family lipoprotein n=1 Tax=Aquirhabdus sp. TaxID=2824160 RepID=UPI00396CC5D2